MKQDAFRDSITAYAEAANLVQQRRRESLCKDIGNGGEDPLIITETHRLIGLGNDVHDTIPALKRTIHLKALSTALQMARSHHALAVEVAAAVDNVSTAPGEDSSDLLQEAAKEAANHHLCAYKVICEIRRLREASDKASAGQKNTLGRFKGAGKMIIMANRLGEAGGRLTARGRDIGLVSFAVETLCAQTGILALTDCFFSLWHPRVADQSK